MINLPFSSKNDMQEILANFRETAEKQEELSLHPYAALSKNHQRKFSDNKDYRLPYKRDVDRIIHSKAYARYVDKTQVVYLIENDHITHRSLHVQLVSSFARGIAEILQLNVDLVEAISLGHDVGHPPFGHEGEGYLSELSQEFGNGPFSHPLQSCRLFSEIEPLNLNLAVYDGFLCHDGGMNGYQLTPCFEKTWETHELDKKSKKSDPEKNIWPGTLEGCLVKICDTLSYVGRDIEDAISLGILNREQVPKTILGNTNRSILGALASDLIRQSYSKNYIALSEEVYEALRQLRAFNFKHIYIHPRLKIESHKIKRSYRILFEMLLEGIEKHRENSHVWKEFVSNKSEQYAHTSSVQMIIDYIAGMTDSFFIRTLERLVVPRQIELL